MTLSRTTIAPRPLRRPRRTIVRAVLATLSVAVLVSGALLSVTRASAIYAELTETGAPGMLQLRADSSMPLWTTLAPGESMQWLVEASLADADRGTLDLELRSTGSLVDTAGLTAAVVSCERAFATDQPGEPRCTAGSRTELPPTPLAAISTMDGGTLHSLLDLDRNHPRHLLITLSLPRGAAVDDGAQAVVGLGLHAAGDTPARPPEPGTPPGDPGPRGPLAMTGDDLLPLLLLAAGLCGLGALALLKRRAPERVAGGSS
ncbi:hypothetical protein GCM10009847_09060 [Leucobacter tardus]|uniref:Gram-positive cocci surface proteins LPxTG domain-containing protein n=1 Tax=Leucobacter tardus TaxID=501483 RepID=A0A939QC75_9MICO|nr:hypothetical protein [Leucobacter tardus]MBO2989107.1 hypothetical protein [Leucobacter tardus]